MFACGEREEIIKTNLDRIGNPLNEVRRRTSSYLAEFYAVPDELQCPISFSFAI